MEELSRAYTTSQDLTRQLTIFKSLQ